MCSPNVWIWVQKHILFRKFCLLLLMGFLIYWVYIDTIQTKLGILLLNPSNLNGDRNYFANVDRYLSRGYLVNTSSCTILDMDPFDPSILHILNLEPRATPNCHNQRHQARRWTYINGSTIIFNTTALREDGFSFDHLDCCYIHFDRVEQSIDNYDEFVAKIVKVSKSCTPILHPRTQIRETAIRIICRGKWPVSQDVLYREFHPLIKITPIVQERFNYWKSQPKNHPKPPSIFLIGLDSTSRLNFHRNMPETKKVLQSLGFLEFYGYTKGNDIWYQVAPTIVKNLHPPTVGENTYPNFYPIASGYSEGDLEKICLFTRSPQDSCPYIWKRFQNANYVTGILEDQPKIAVFKSFAHEPVDYYLRPFFLGVELNDLKEVMNIQSIKSASWIIEQRCIGTKTGWEVMLKYINELNKLSTENGAPLFLFSWLTSMTHDYLKGAQDGDIAHAEFFKAFDYTNSIVIVLGDHGYRFGKVRQTFVGWYEDKLPAFWIYLPKSVKSNHPNWFKALQENARRVTSPFDLFSTMSHVLDEYTSADQMPISSVPSGSRKKVPRVYGQSLFNPISQNRTCDDAGIPSSYCACFVPQRVSINDTNLKLAAEAAVQRINTMITPECTNLTLVQVTAGARLQRNAKKSGTYIVGFRTKPGNFLFESDVDYSGSNSPQFRPSGNILRMSKITTDVSCVEDSVLQRFCYCTSNS